jgi:hypothetical protein
MLGDDTTTSHQQVDLYSTLILALPEDDMPIIDNISETDKNCDVAAWAALVDHYEDDNIYRHLSELLQDMKTSQAHNGNGINYMNRVVRLQRQLARVGDGVHDRRVIMYLVKGFRNEYHCMTDTWDVHSLSMDAVKRNLR